MTEQGSERVCPEKLFQRCELDLFLRAPARARAACFAETLGLVPRVLEALLPADEFFVLQQQCAALS